MWALTELMLKKQGGGTILEPVGMIPGLATGRGLDYGGGGEIDISGGMGRGNTDPVF